ncbi:COX15/CtaA family protein [Bauldia sp.]|uniref:COX15/CtaA family protein n=1 Tax=Bauldia sp. TaxID=2575872 RepID=UPI003BAB0980
MTTAVNTHDIDAGQELSRGPVYWWLICVALLIVVMVVVGGATRLTDSGLSITEWQPIHGVIPPLSEAEWQEEFDKYKQIPEYQLINKGMSLEAFKTIFWWEWGHRFLGRFIGLVFIVPLVWFWVTGRLSRQLAPKLLAIFILGGLQGVVGWWMVASGLTERTDVSQYRLAVHLTLACAIFAYVLWVAGGLRRIEPGTQRGLKVGAALVLALVFVQIFLGGLVAGLDAGLVSDTWPLMNGHLVPPGLLIMEPVWLNLFENAATVHFNHRVVGYLLLVAALVHVWQVRGTAHAALAGWLAVAVLAQAAIGVANVLAAVPISLAIVHQLGAVVVLALAVANLRAMVPTRAPAAESVPAAAA